MKGRKSDSMPMICPSCESEEIGVSDTRKFGSYIIRVKKCNKCKHTWKTIENDLDQWNSMLISISNMKQKIATLVQRIADLEKENRELKAKLEARR